MHQAQLGDRVQVQYFRTRTHGAESEQLGGRKTCDFTVGGSDVFPAPASASLE